MRIWPGFLGFAVIGFGAPAFGQKNSSIPTPALIGYSPTPVSATYNPGSAVAASTKAVQDPAGIDAPQEAQRQRLRAYLTAEAMKKNAADTDRLLALARDLNARSQNPTPLALTLSDVKEAEEIEKLARRVKGRLGAQ